MVVRILVVAAVAGAALGAAFLMGRRTARRAERRSLDLTGLPGRVLLFTDRSCGSCERMRAMLSDAGIRFAEVVYQDDPDAWERARVDTVPLLVVRGEAGEEVARVAGVPSRRRLRQAVAALSPDGNDKTVLRAPGARKNDTGEITGAE